MTHASISYSAENITRHLGVSYSKQVLILADYSYELIYMRFYTSTPDIYVFCVVVYVLT